MKYVLEVSFLFTVGINEALSQFNISATYAFMLRDEKVDINLMPAP